MKINSPPNMNYAWSGQMIREFICLGIDTFYIAPGSRSSPLAISAAEYARHIYVHFDERGVGFAALGHARATGRPAVVITTSGSATANLWPAVCEASNDAIPIIILTADRPPELRDTGANQTMDQVKMFGGYVRWQIDLPSPDINVPAKYLLSTIDYAVHRATKLNPGPVHINQMFREPLAPVRAKEPVRQWLAGLGRRENRRKPWTDYAESECAPSSSVMREVNARMAKARKGLIIAGAARSASETRALLQIAEKLGWPVLPDIRSGLRIGRSHPLVIRMADQLLLSDRFVKSMQPDLIIHLGGRITSKRIQSYLASQSATLMMVSELCTRMDPDSRIDVRLNSSLSGFAKRIRASNKTTVAWLKKWKTMDRMVVDAWTNECASGQTLTEPMVAEIVAGELPVHQQLVLASSMPIRDMDMYGLGQQEEQVVFSNRGVSGIDGNLATAIGIANGSNRPVTLIAGDLALLHDLNSLAMIKAAAKPVTIIAVNNDGGGIFSFLPVNKTPHHFETCFGTPHGHDFADAASMFDIAYVSASTRSDLITACRRSYQGGKSTLIEVKTQRVANMKEHQRIQAKLKKLIEHAC